MNRFLSRAYCSAMSRLVSSLSGTPNKHLQLPRLRLGVLVLKAMLDDISNLRCFGVRPPAAIVGWIQRNIWLIISRENSCRFREGRNAGASGSGAPGDQSRANSNLKVVGVRTRMPTAYDWRYVSRASASFDFGTWRANPGAKDAFYTSRDTGGLKRDDILCYNIIHILLMLITQCCFYL